MIARGRVRIDADDPPRSSSMSDAQAQSTRRSAASDGAIRVRRALISVSDKTGVADFARASPRSGSRSSRPAAPRRRCARPGSR